MSVREEDKNKNCPSRGLGIAAAAIGVGVGAALYYFFNKRSENPADEGATTSGWNCEQPHSLSPWKVFPKYFRSAGEEMNKMREQAFRERSWTLEECSICFEAMLKDQEVFALSCTHRFHQACIMPWLQEQQTCPMCRKAS